MYVFMLFDSVETDNMYLCSFDPLGLKPSNANELKDMSSKELNNGRLAMIGIAGMVAQELVSGKELFQ
jgi:Chlorophyll A-B binding protein